MSEAVEFGSLEAANNARDEWGEWVCPVDDDRRFLTVHFQSDTPEDVLDVIRAEADEGRAAREDSGPGQVELTDAERDRIDFSKPRANLPWAQSIKALAQRYGVSDWTSHVDPTLTVDEHRQIMREAAREGGGKRDDSHEERRHERERRAAAAEQGQQCDHAADHCEHGDQEACEFLRTACGFDDEVADLLAVTDGGRVDDRDELTGEEKGALDRSWGGYHGAVDEFEAALDALRQAWTDAQQSARAINGIREGVGQPPLDFDALEAAQADLLDLLRTMADDCVECHADHTDHDHPVTAGDRESITAAVREGVAETPVGVDDDADLPPSAVLADREPDRTDPDRSIPDRPDGLARLAEQDDPGDPADRHDPRPSTDDGAGSFGVEQQGTLDVGVDSEGTAEEKQVTLTGDDESESLGALPSTWVRQEAERAYSAGPLEVRWSHNRDTGRWRVDLQGPDHSEALATGLRDGDRAEAIAREWVDRVDPDDVSFHSGDSTVVEAAAEAKQATERADSGLKRFA